MLTSHPLKRTYNVVVAGSRGSRHSATRKVSNPSCPCWPRAIPATDRVGSLLAACPEWLRPIVGFAVATGMRRSEILGMRWLDVDWNHASIMLPQTKNGEGRIVPLNQLALAALRSVVPLPEKKTTGLVFTGITPEQVSVAFARLCRNEKVLDFRFSRSTPYGCQLDEDEGGGYPYRRPTAGA
jgi:integrase